MQNFEMKNGEKYRTQGNHLYKLDGDAYIHCYQNIRHTGFNLLMAYQEYLNSDEALERDLDNMYPSCEQ